MYRILSYCIWIFCLFSLQAYAQQNRLILKNANEMIRDTTNNTLHLKGKVQLIFQQQYLSCDEAFVYLDTKTIEAIGNVIYITPTVYSESNKVYFNYKNSTGVIHNGYLQSGQVSFEGKLIYKLGENEYESIDGHYTACATCPPSWSLTGSSLRADLGGYARIKNSFFKIADVPIFWIPYLIIPLKSDRETGFLFPEYATSRRSGNIYSESFFWAINRSNDATFTISSFQTRGTMFQGEYRYVLSPTSKGMIQAATIKDELFPTSTRVRASNNGQEIGPIDRWYLMYEHSYELPYYFKHKMDINLASDLQYAADFPVQFPFFREPAIENRMSLSKNNEDSQITIDSSIYISTLQTDPLASNEDAVHRFPNFRYSLMPQKVENTRLYYTFDIDYINIARTSYSFDKIDPTQPINGRFDSNYIPVIDHDGSYDKDVDQIRSGQRLILRPKLFYALNLGPFDFLPSLSYQENAYKFAVPEDNEAESRFFKTELKFLTNINKVYGNEENQKTDPLIKHEIIPQLVYKKIAWDQRSNHKFFNDNDLLPYTSDLAINDAQLLQFDYFDRFTDRDVIEYGIKQIWTQKRWSGYSTYLARIDCEERVKEAAESQENKEESTESLEDCEKKYAIDTNSEESYTYRQFLIWELLQVFDFREATRDIEAPLQRQAFSDIRSDLRLNLDQFQLASRVQYYPYQNHVNSTTSMTFLTDSGQSQLSLAYVQAFSILRGVREVDYDTRQEDIIAQSIFRTRYLNFAGRAEYSLTQAELENYSYGFFVKPPGNCWAFSIAQTITEEDTVTTFNFELVFDGIPDKKFIPAEFL